MTPEQIEKTVKYYGTESQIIKAIEELSELQKELCKCLLDGKSKQDLRPIIDELADVEIMCEQLRHIFRISIEVDDRKEFKVDRLMKIILINENP